MTILHKRIALLLALILVSVWFAGCSQGPATELPTVQATAQPTAKPTASPTTQPTLKPVTQPTTQPTLQPTTQPAGDTPVAPEIFEPVATADDLATRLQRLDLDEFFEISWRELMLRDPESVLAEGLAETYHLKGAQLTDISDDYRRETQRMYAIVLDMLHTYDRAALTPEAQVSYDVYEWYLDDRLREEEFMYYDYPATYFPVTAVHEQLIQFFTDLHPIADKQDAQDYVTRLGQVNTKFEQLIEGLELREQAGIVPPQFAIQWAVYGVRNLANASATRTPFYQTLQEKISALPDISAADQESLLQAAEKAINESVLPAFQALANDLQQQESIAPTDDGLWQFPNGEAYYAHLLRHYTTTDMTADEIHQLGLSELQRIHTEMRTVFEELGYPQNESLADLFDRVAEDSGYIAGHQVTETYEAIIEQASQNLEGVFDLRPQAQVIVVESPIRGMYVSASLDGSRPGAFHAGPGNASETWYTMPTLAYHEAVPGHHFQIALAQESDLPTFRNMVTFLGYTEGWALYAEQLAWELGWYADDPYGNLGRLQAEAFRAARLVIDTGIHTQGWTFAQAEQFFTENVGYDAGDSVEPRIEIARYIVWPGQATAYKIGMLKMIELRQQAMDELGEQFDLQAFHNVILRNGSMPLQVLERVVDDYIAAASASASPTSGGESEEAQDLHITIVYDNTTYVPGLRSRWGFAAYLEYGDHTLLFDTGGDSYTLLRNMEDLDLDPRAIEIVVLSHIHEDHTGGLEGLLNTGVRPVVYVPASFPDSFKESVRQQTELISVSEALEILPGIYSTGEVSGSVLEQGLVVETPQGIVVMTGCAHPGILRMVRQARDVLPGEIALVIGGFHLDGASSAQIRQIVAAFRDLGVRQASPTHCTGQAAIEAFANEYEDDYLAGGVGRAIVVGPAPQAETP